MDDTQPLSDEDVIAQLVMTISARWAAWDKARSEARS